LLGKDPIANVEIHKKSRHVITEDIARFFDCVTAEHVYTIWHKFFRFGDEVARLLTKLTTKDGRLVQGASTSSYLANLVFWRREPGLVERLKARGIRYSRYVDDITLSSTSKLSKDDTRWAIGQIYALLGAAGFKPQRAKHDTLSASGPITLMGMNANREPTLVKQRRSNIRTQVFQLEQRFARKEICGAALQTELNRTKGKIVYVSRLHPREGAAMQRRLNKLQSEFERGIARAIDR